MSFPDNILLLSLFARMFFCNFEVKITFCFLTDLNTTLALSLSISEVVFKSVWMLFITSFNTPRFQTVPSTVFINKREPCTMTLSCFQLLHLIYQEYDCPNFKFVQIILIIVDFKVETKGPRSILFDCCYFEPSSKQRPFDQDVPNSVMCHRIMGAPRKTCCCGHV